MIHVIYMAAGNSRRFGSNKLLVSWRGKPLYRHTLDLLFERQKAWAERCLITITVVTQYEQILRELGEFAGREGVSLVYCEDSKKGVSYTIRAGIQAVLSQNAQTECGMQAVSSTNVQHGERCMTESASLRDGYRSQTCGETSQDMWMFVVADQPLLRAASIDALLQTVCDAGELHEKKELSSVCACFDEKQESPGACVASDDRQESPEAFSLSCHGQVGNPCVFSDALIPELLVLEGDQGGRTVLRRHRCMYVEIEDAAEFMDIDSAEDAGRIGGMTDVDGNMAL